MSKEKGKPNGTSLSDYTVEQRAREEGWKLKYDFYKHLTTLGTGSILLLVTFLEKIFARPVWKGLVATAFCLLLTSTLTSLVEMNVISSVIQYMEIDEKDEKRSVIIVVVTLASFVLGIISLVIFTVKNLYV